MKIGLSSEILSTMGEKTWVIIPLLIMLLSGCTPLRKNRIQPGISGQVLWYEGDLMPGPGKTMPGGTPVIREIVICSPAINIDTSTPNFYSYEKVRIVKTTMSDSSGNFAIELPPGRYSVFVKEKSRLFADITDGMGAINPVKVENNQVTKIVLKVDYNAVY